MERTYISHEPEVLGDTLCFDWARVPVQNLIDYLEGSSSLHLSRCGRSGQSKRGLIMPTGTIRLHGVLRATRNVPIGWTLLR